MINAVFLVLLLMLLLLMLFSLPLPLLLLLLMLLVLILACFCLLTTTELHSEALTNSAIRPWVQFALRANFVQLLQFRLFVQCSRFLSVFAFNSRHICFKRCLAQAISLVAEWIDTYGIHHWIIFRCSYKKLPWVGFKPTTTELCSDALADWAITPWVKLPLRANFLKLLQFYHFAQCSRFFLASAIVSCYICLKQSLTRVTTLVVE